MNIFEQAARKKLRFNSVKGPLSAEHLFDLPLSSKTGFDLDSVAKAVNAALKAETEESFVSTVSNPRKADLELALEIVKHVIAGRIAENEALRQKEARRAERDRLIGALANKEEQAIASMSADEIKKRLAELDA